MRDRQGRAVRWNKTREHVLGYSPEELASMPLGEANPPEDRHRLIELFGRVLREGSGSSEHHMLTKDGRKFPALAHGARVSIGGEDYVLGVTLDVSPLKHTEEELRRALAELQELRGRIELENAYLRQEIAYQPEEVVGDSAAIHRVLSQMEQVAAAASADELAARLGPYARALVLWFVARLGNFGLVTLEFLLTAIIAALMYANGESAASGVLRLARRLAGERGERSVHLASQAIRSVALGVVLTALIQAFLGGIGLAIVGVPFVLILTAVMFLLAIAQLGPLAVLLPAVVWLYWRGSPGWGTALPGWSVVVIPLDNILRPILIRKGVDLPLILIFAAAVGGLIAFGLVGIFVGPVILAVGQTLLEAWVVEAAPPSLELE